MTDKDLYSELKPSNCRFTVQDLQADKFIFCLSDCCSWSCLVFLIDQDLLRHKIRLNRFWKKNCK
jgi:hypothetical protein